MLFNFDEINKQKSYILEERQQNVVFDETTAPAIENFTKTAESKFDIFLSYRSLDKKDAEILVRMISSFGFSVYVDWLQDSQLDRANVTRKTAETIRKRLQQSRCLLYAASASAHTSNWMPWEVGYMDAFNGRVAILPIGLKATSMISDVIRGQEYLTLYPYVSKDISNKTKKQILWTNESENRYCPFSSWLQGEMPKSH